MVDNKALVFRLRNVARGCWMGEVEQYGEGRRRRRRKGNKSRKVVALVLRMQTVPSSLVHMTESWRRGMRVTERSHSRRATSSAGRWI